MRSATATTGQAPGRPSPRAIAGPSVQSPPAASAQYRPNEGAPVEGRRDADGFDVDLALLAKNLRFAVHDLSDHESRLIEDFARGASVDGEVRYRMKTLRDLCAIAARTNRPELRDALPELIRAEIYRGAGAMDVTKAFDQETPAPGQADVDQRAYEKDPNPLNWDRCWKSLLRQLAVTRNAVDAMWVRRPAALKATIATK